MTVAVRGTAPIREGVVYSDTSSHGLTANDCNDFTFRDSVVRKCKFSGVRDYGNAIRSRYLNLSIVGNGRNDQHKDSLGRSYNGDGILLQGRDGEVTECTIAHNGFDNNYEHGIYIAGSLPDKPYGRNYHVHHNVLVDNACSGIKVGGTGTIEHNAIYSSRYGMVFEGDVPGDAIVRNNTIRALTYAILVTSQCRLARFKSDYNVFGPAPKFRMPGRTLTLAQWRSETGNDTHSVEMP